ncbi:MAG: SCO family protein [Pseudomonadota bacterium]
MRRAVAVIAASVLATLLAAASPFPIAIEADFDLIGPQGRVTDEDMRGRPVALFFGYANCESICTVALPRMAEALEILGEDGGPIQPVMITVDPARDTPEALAVAMPRWHPRFLGLTGDEAALSAALDAFQVDVQVVAHDPVGQPIYAHGSFIYLIGPDGVVKTVMPPVLAPERIAELMRKHLL